MDEAEGFFPERKLLAYRRSLRRVEPVPAAPAGQTSSAWWIIFMCLGPSFFAIGGSMYPQHAAGGHLPPTLIFGTYLLVAVFMMFAVLGICVGIYRGLRTQKLLTRK
jgi:hypothetical protein